MPAVPDPPAPPNMPAPPEPPGPHDLVRHHTVYAAVVGSRAFGLATEASDTDVRGVYLAPTSAYWLRDKPPRHVDGPADQQFSWELEHVCELALEANPNVLETLWSPLVHTLTPVGEELLALRPAFLSRRAERTFLGYAASQFDRLQRGRRGATVVAWKPIMHLLRLLLSGAELLRTGEPLVDVGGHRDRLLAVRRGELPWPEVDAWRRTLQDELAAAGRASPLPEEPDADRVERWLYAVRARSAAETLATEGRLRSPDGSGIGAPYVVPKGQITHRTTPRAEETTE